MNSGVYTRGIRAWNWFREQIRFPRGYGESDASSTGRENGATDSGTERVSAELLQFVTPQEQILRLLEDNDGRLTQSDIGTAVEWSKATVSRKLCELESAGEITRYQIGREKIVFLPGAEPDSFTPRSKADREERSLTP